MSLVWIRWLAPVALLLLLLFVASHSLIGAQTADHVLISEVMYDPVGTEPGGEWVELYNPTSAAVSLSGWKLRDNNSTDVIPDFTLGPGEYLVIASSRSAFESSYPGFTGNLVSLESAIGNGLSNSGDRVSLLNAAGQEVDAMSYGTDTSAFNPSCPTVPEGQSLARVPSDRDTDTREDWVAQAVPNPGGPGERPTPTPTATAAPTPTDTATATATLTLTPTPSATPTLTATPTATLTPTLTVTTPASATPSPSVTPTVTPGPTDTATMTFTPGATATPSVTPSATALPRVLLSEVLYDAVQGGTDSNWEWVEVYNADEMAVELSGWRIGDNGGEDAIPAFVLGPGEYLVIAATLAGFSENHPDFAGHLVTLENPIGNGLANTGDVVQLIAPDGTVADAMSYGNNTQGFDPPCPGVGPGQSLARVPSERDTDTREDWLAQAVPNPGGPGERPTPTPTATAAPTPTDTATPMPTATATATATSTVTATVTASASPSPSVTPTVTPGPTDTATVTLTPSVTPSATALPRVLLSEVLYDAVQGGTDSNWEWVEVYNAEEVAVELSGWRIGDNGGEDVIPAFVLGPGEYLVIAATLAGFRENHPDFVGHLVTLENPIGNGLANTGDVVRLMAPDGTVVDAMSYGNNTQGFDPPCPGVGPGQSLARVPSERDTDTREDWLAQAVPNPGGPGERPTPTPTATAAPTPTDTATPTATATATATPTLTLTPTPSATPALTVTLTATLTPTLTAPASATPSPSVTPTVTPGPTDTATVTLTPGATWTPSVTPSATALPRVLLSEVLYDAVQGGTDSNWEWVEVYNAEEVAVELSGWRIGDNGGEDVIPAFMLGPGEYLVIAATLAGFSENHPDFAGHLVTLENPIGNGLANTGDVVRLMAPDGTVVDAMSYGNNTQGFDPPCPGVGPGQSLARVPSERDTDTREDWLAQAVPNPGGPGERPTPTPTATAAPTPTDTATPMPTATATATATSTVTATVTASASPSPSVTPTVTPGPTDTATVTFTPGATATPSVTPTATALPRVLLSEVLYDAVQGGTDSNWEWVEVYNAEEVAVELSGWRIGDNGGEDVIPAFVLGPGEYLVIAATLAGFSENHPGFVGHLVTLENPIGNGLANTGDVVRLMAPDGTVVDAMSYGNNTQGFDPPCPGVGPGQSLARVPSERDTDTREDWAAQPIPNPGGPGVPPALTSTPTATVTPTPTPTAATTPTSTPWETPTPTSPPVRPGDVVINEIMQNPRAVADSVGEWFELYNATDHPIDLNGWTIKDERSDRHTIANGEPLWLPAGGYLVLGRNRNPITNGGVAVAYEYKNFVLGNGADEIILLDRNGVEIDRVAYDGGPVFPNPNGASMQLIRPELDNSNGAHWRAAVELWPGSAGDAGSPGAANDTASIEGHVFEDRNGNGHRDAEELELGIPDVLITLRGETRPGLVRTLRTFPNGWYGFYDLPAGAYWVIQTQPEGYVSTTPDEVRVVVSAGESSLGHDFGEGRLPPTATPTTGPSPTSTPASWPRVLLSEVLYDAVQGGTDNNWEWVEVYNADEVAVELSGWRIGDNGGEDVIPAFVLGPGEYLVIAATLAGFRENHPDFAGYLVTLENPIGNGLANTGDVVRLMAPDGTVVDAMSYGNNTQGFDPPCPGVGPGQSLARVPSERDTDTREDWAAQAVPNPGGPGERPTPTPTATVTATATATFAPTPTATTAPTPTATMTATPGEPPAVRLNEVLPRPDAIDWDGDGQVNAYDEWIELYNLGPDAVDLGGWMLDDILNAGSRPYIFPAGTVLEPGGFLVRYRSTTGVALNQDADSVNLIAPDGRLVDSFSYSNPRRDVSYSRTVDGTGDWTDTYPPSPGRPNLPGPATPTPTPTVTRTPTLTRTPTPTRTPSPTRTPTPTPTPTFTPTPVVYDPTAVRLNELLPWPQAVDWDGDGVADAYDEWIELFNLSPVAVDLGGWGLDDVAEGGSRPYIFPAGTWLDGGGFLVVYRRQSGIALNNDGDTVRLLGPDGAELDTFTYRNPRPDRSYSRTVDGTGVWTDTYPPSPGRSNAAPTPTPTATATATPTQFPAGVYLNEILPDPKAVDWDGNGIANFADEWVELYNAGSAPAALGGWALADDTKTYTLPVGTVIWPGGYLLLFRGQTGLALGDNRDQVSLLRPDGTIADRFAYDTGPGADRSYCRSQDGGGYWTRECYVTPGEANRLLPPPPTPAGGTSPGATSTPAIRPSQLAAARAAPLDTRITITGAVTYPPGLIPRTIYIQDATAGIKVYLRTGEFPPLALGDQVRVTGWLRDFRGEAELSVPNPSYLAVLGPGSVPDPLPITTAALGEEHEGRLVWLAGRVVRFERQALVLDDGSGPARVYFPASLPWRRPYVEIGQFWAAQGVVSQYAFDGPPWVGGYRLLPRFASDVNNAPIWLPVTGVSEKLWYNERIERP